MVGCRARVAPPRCEVRPPPPPSYTSGAARRSDDTKAMPKKEAPVPVAAAGQEARPGAMTMTTWLSCSVRRRRCQDRMGRERGQRERRRESVPRCKLQFPLPSPPLSSPPSLPPPMTMMTMTSSSSKTTKMTLANDLREEPGAEAEAAEVAAAAAAVRVVRFGSAGYAPSPTPNLPRTAPPVRTGDSLEAPPRPRDQPWDKKYFFGKESKKYDFKRNDRDVQDSGRYA